MNVLDFKTLHTFKELKMSQNVQQGIQFYATTPSRTLMSWERLCRQDTEKYN